VTILTRTGPGRPRLGAAPHPVDRRDRPRGRRAAGASPSAPPPRPGAVPGPARWPGPPAAATGRSRPSHPASRFRRSNG